MLRPLTGAAPSHRKWRARVSAGEHLLSVSYLKEYHGLPAKYEGPEPADPSQFPSLSSARGKLDSDAWPDGQGDGQPIKRREQCDGQVQPVGNGESAHVHDRREDQHRGEDAEQDFGKRTVDHGSHP